MVASGTTVQAADWSERNHLLAKLQDRAIYLALPCLAYCGLGLQLFPRWFQNPELAQWMGMLLWLLALLVWGVRHLSRTAAGIVLVLGLILANVVTVNWSGEPTVLFLLTLPVGLAALCISAIGGIVTAAICALIVLGLPPTLLPVGLLLRLITLIGIGSTIAFIWLASRPLLTTLEWSWSSYERSERLLEQARDYQVQLKQTMKDLADANLQLTRLNHLAHTLRQAAEQARLAKQEFVANVSHELRTPLNMIIGFTEMITQAPDVYGGRLPPALMADLGIILRNSQHLSSLIDDVLDLSQIEAKRMALTKERVLVADITEAAVVAVRPLFDSKGLWLRTEMAKDLCVFGDRTRIREVLLNLLSNAGRFTDQGGVEIRAWHEGHDVVISVADTGPGIRPEDQERLFRPFQQLDGSVRRRYGGTGLGLAISRHFVELHGGTMWVESKEGQGTVFFCRLPTEPPSAPGEGAARWLTPAWEYEERTRPSTAPAPVLRPRLVILDPAGPLRRLVARYLPSVEIVTVTSLEEATRELMRTPSQGLLVNNASLAQTLQHLNVSGALPTGVPAIVCAIPGIPEAADSLGVADYLVKPVSRESLLGALNRLDIHGGKVLLVDDEPEALRLFWRMLAGAEGNYTVLTASTGEEALRVLQCERPDAMLLDLTMPGMDGFRLLEERDQDPGLKAIPVIVVSACDPTGQPVVSSAVAITLGGGMASHEVLACIDAIRRTLAPTDEPGDPKQPPSQPA